MEKNSLQPFFEIFSSNKIICFLPKNKVSTSNSCGSNLSSFSSKGQNVTQAKRNSYESTLKSGSKGLFLTFKSVIMFVIVSLFGFTTATAQTFPSASSCTSKDLALVSATLPYTKCETCTPEALISKPLTLGIINKTGSTRTSFAFWATLKIINANGTVASTTPISGCFGPITRNTTKYFEYGNIQYTCGQSLSLTDIWEAWTDASPGSTCAALLANTSTINPKCGTNPLLNIISGDDANYTITKATCTSGGSISVAPIGGTAPYTVKIYDVSDNLISSQTIVAGSSYKFSNLASGTYIFKITDANNCAPVVQSRTVELNNDLSAPSATPAQPLCSTATGSINVTAPIGSGYSYSIDGTNYQSQTTFSGLAAKSYNVTVKNTVGCISPATVVSIIAPPALVFTSASVTSPILCAGGTGTVTIAATGGTAPISYTFNSQTNTTGVFTGVLAGTNLSYSITDANNCGPLTGTINVTQPPALAFTSASVTDPILCNGGKATVTIVATGGTEPLSYTFNGETNSEGVFAGVSAGTNLIYSITDKNSCGPITGTINVTQPPALALTSASVTSPIVCNGETAAVTIVATGGTAPISYTFNNQTNTTGIFTGVSAGTNLPYSITDANNCGPIRGTMNVIQPTALALTSAEVTGPIFCNGGTATVTIVATGGTAPISYTFNNQTNTTGVFTRVSAGTNLPYSITDANKCGPLTGTIDVTQPPAVALTSASVTSPILCNGGKATVTIVGSGGTAPLSYTFNGNTNSAGVFENISAGDNLPYSITDANNCGPITGTINVTEPSILDAPTICVVQPSLCSSTGSITVLSPTGDGYQYSIDNGTTWQTTTLFDNLAAGSNPSIIVQSPQGCISSSASSCDASNCSETAPIAKIEKTANPEAKKSEPIAPAEITITNKTETVGFEAYPVPFKDQLTIKYKFDYVSDVLIEMFDTNGYKVISKVDTHSYLDKEVVLDYHLNKGSQQVYIVRLTTKLGHSERKVLSSY